MNTHDYKKLTPEEKRVIVAKGTESPFTGEYDKHFKPGVYHCRRCNAPLYRSEDKFDSGCGWPAFDDEIPGAVCSRPDADGRRTEITCADCGAHLGHVFTGEKLTDKDVRHCVNSISMRFVPADGNEKAVFAGGCFWGIEEFFKNAEGVVNARVGYTGGALENPNYEQVCSGNTGHYEAVEVTFDSNRTSYEEMIKLFFQIHDFTQTDGQGPDRGPQYRSAIFYSTAGQKETARTVIEKLEDMGHDVATRVLPAKKFWEAEDYHQDYYEKTGRSSHCHTYKQIF